MEVGISIVSVIPEIADYRDSGELCAAWLNPASHGHFRPIYTFVGDLLALVHQCVDGVVIEFNSFFPGIVIAEGVAG